VAAADTVLLATPMAPEFAGFADWHAALPAERRPAAAVHFLLPLGYELAADLAWQEDFALLAHGEAFARLRASAGARSLYLAHPAPLAERLAAFDPRIAVFPSPSALPEPAPAVADVPTVAFLGRGKAVKGIDLAFAAFDRLQAEGARLRWIFQTAPLALDARRRAALAAPNVRHLGEFATQAEYLELLRASSIVVLPYRPDAYGSDQGSGVLSEALAMGIPAVCSEAAFAATQLARLGCPELVFRPYSAEALAAKIAEVARDYPRYRARFAAAAGAAALSPARLVERLCGVARAAPEPAGAQPAAGGRANGAARGASLLSLLDIRLRALAGGAASRRKAPGAAAPGPPAGG
jgi:glycosyltransferase involved in cell wall biosynthesis